jgi:IS5 family transposase
MRPQKPKMTGEGDLFRARHNMKHELVQLGGKVDWDWIIQRHARRPKIYVLPLRPVLSGRHATVL